VSNCDYYEKHLPEQKGFKYVCGYLIRKCLKIHTYNICEKFPKENDDLDNSNLFLHHKAYIRESFLFVGLKSPHETFYNYIYSLQQTFFANFEHHINNQPDRTVLTDIHIQHNRPDIIILNKQQKQAYLLDIAVPNSHNIPQTYNTKINKYLELSVAMRNLWCLEKNSILPFIISATGIVPQSLFKNLKILDLENTLVVEIQKGILLYSCHIVRKFLNIDTEHKTQKSQNAEARRR
jgi:hypothetical protein